MNKADTNQSLGRALRATAVFATVAGEVVLGTTTPAGALVGATAPHRGLVAPPAPAPVTGFSLSQLTSFDLAVVGCIVVVAIGALALLTYHKRRTPNEGSPVRDIKVDKRRSFMAKKSSKKSSKTASASSLEAGGAGTGAVLLGEFALTQQDSQLPLQTQGLAFSQGSIEPGWYPITNDPTLQNYWDGTAWTSKIRWDGTAWQQVA